MELAIVGLGKMGSNMARRLLRGGHRVMGYNRLPEVTRRLAAETELIPAFSLEETVAKLEARPRVVWVMVPAGAPTESVVQALGEQLTAGDIVIDGGNTFYKDDLRRAAVLAERGIRYVDVGTSGGVWGLTEGYSMMSGGDKETVEHLRPIFETLAPAPDRGWGHVGPVGAGHFVKMMHNGIEYGVMQAYAEGFEILKSKQEFDLDLHQIAEIWRFGSVIRSWLLDLTARALAEDPDLAHIKGWVADSGEGRWTVFGAIDLDVPAPVITLALQMRFVSRQEESFAAKVLAAMRHQFGGHAVKRE
ncbi:MAG TPA: decarboxylating 6-phosphogluconate dehydrogenase [Anaerolineae bacterium]|nr:decarboxylating 6-phosphogluconate dehydrogenase [Anaerolineae bacterium]HID85023.1 decarboxylating 6-phosphogluconate dehydrogenase [Anaerolineales bacterium]HIQ08175.1 decarboxylating 6-phosphogluconate dehydrogenase [Anaerolineaceae bacterium]